MANGKVMDNTGFFSGLCFLFGKDAESQKKMIGILEKDMGKARKEIEKDIESATILMAGEGQGYFSHFEKLAKKGFEISCRNLWNYRNYLVKTFSSFDIEDPSADFKTKAYIPSGERFIENSDNDIIGKVLSDETKTTSQFFHSVYFGYRLFRNDDNSVSKMTELLRKTKKSSLFFLNLDMGKAEQFIKTQELFRQHPQYEHKQYQYVDFLYNTDRAKYQEDLARNYLDYLSNIKSNLMQS